MSHESRKADQAGQADAGISSGADSSRRRPSGEEAGEESTPQARTSPDGIEAFRGYRLWRLVAGQLRSHRNDTVWANGPCAGCAGAPGDGVLEGEDQLPRCLSGAVYDHRHDGCRSLGNTLRLGRCPSGRPVAAIQGHSSIECGAVVVCYPRCRSRPTLPPVPCGQSQAHGPGRGCGVEHSGHLRDALAVRRPGLGRPIGAWSDPCTRHSLAVGGYHRA